MKIHKKVILVALIVVIGIILFVCSKLTNRNNHHKISISANVEALEVNIAFEIPGKLKELTVNEGDRVSKGTLIASLDQEELLHQRDRARANLSATEAQAAQLKTAIQFQQETLQGQTDLRQAELSQAEARLKELLSGSRDQEIEQARALADRARAEYSRAKNDWERANVLYEKGDISTSLFEQYKSTHESTRASLKQAEEHLALVIEGPRKEDIEMARSQVKQAEAGLRLAKAQRLEIKRKEQELEMALANIERSRSELAIIETQLKETEAISPIEGIVLVKTAEVGEVLAAGTTVVTIGDILHPWIRGYINEKDLDRVKLGAKARVTTDSGKLFWGRLSFISSEAEFTPKQIQTDEERVKLVYRIKIDIENPEGELKLNMPVEAEILL